MMTSAHRRYTLTIQCPASTKQLHLPSLNAVQRIRGTVVAVGSMIVRGLSLHGHSGRRTCTVSRTRCPMLGLNPAGGIRGIGLSAVRVDSAVRMWTLVELRGGSDTRRGPGARPNAPALRCRIGRRHCIVAIVEWEGGFWTTPGELFRLHVMLKLITEESADKPSTTMFDWTALYCVPGALE